MFCFAHSKDISKLGEKFCAKRGPPSNFEYEPNNNTFLFTLDFFFDFLKCESSAQLLCSVTPKSSSLPVTNTKSEISALLSNK
jgi:hypothetical protein